MMMGRDAAVPLLLLLMYGILVPSGASFCSGTARLDVNASVQAFSDGSAPGAQYADSTNCWWLLSASVGGTVRLGFVRLDTEFNFDFVTVFDGANSSERQLGKFSGNKLPPLLHSTGASMLVHLTSDSDADSTGFEALYTLASAPPFPTPAPTPFPWPTPAPGTLGCTVTVNPAAVPPPAGTCMSIGPCLVAMPASCATKTLLLQPGTYTGSQNTRIDLSGTDSVSIVGPTAPSPLRVGPDGTAEMGDATAPPPAVAVATIDGEGAEWLFAVGGSAMLLLAHVVLTRGQGGHFDRGDGRLASGGGALRVTGSGAVNATGVLFDSNMASPASNSAGGAMYTSSNGAAHINGCLFRNNTAVGSYGSGGSVKVYSISAGSAASVAPVFNQCLFEGNRAAAHAGSMYIYNAAPRFSGCTWRENKVTGNYGSGGSMKVYASSAGSAFAPVFKQCLFEGNSAVYGGGGTYIFNAAPHFSNCTWRDNKVTGSKGTGGGVDVESSSAASAASVVPVFEWCMFEGNSVVGYGAGVYVQAAAPHFNGCTWRDNKATGSRSFGGGVYVQSGSAGSALSVAPVFEQSLFEGNSVVQHGGGAFVQDAAPRFIGCSWRGNKATGSSGDGGGVFVWSISTDSAASVAPVFEHCHFEDNTAVKSGGGAAVQDAAPSFGSCTWRDNAATGSFGSGGGVYVRSTSAIASVLIVFDNCTFIGNIAAGQDGGGALVTTVFVADKPANLAFQVDKCSEYSCVQPSSIATPPPTINNTFRQWTPRLHLHFDGGTTFDSNTAATASGGAISAGLGGSFFISGGANFHNNRAGIFGGAAYLAAGTASLAVLGPSTWANNSADSARGDILYSESGGNIALGDATLQLSGDPTRVREGVVAEQAGNVSWGGKSSAVCEPGYTLSAMTGSATSTFQSWVLEGSSNGTAGFRNGSNCPGYYAYCDGVGLSKSTSMAWAMNGYHDPKATTVFPPMRVTRVSVGCAACGATEWSNAAEPLPGPMITAATATRPLNRTCAACEGRMSPGIWCDTGELSQKHGWWRPHAAIDFTTQLFPCYTDACIGSPSGTTGLPSFGAQCKIGYGGPVCALCVDGYTMQSGQCRACPRLDAQNVSGVTLLVLTALGLCTLAYRKRDSPLWQPAILKITLGFFQLVSVMERSFAVKWPSSYRSALHGIKLALASVADLPSTACAFTVSWYQRLCIWTFGMLGFTLGLWCHFRWQRARSSGAPMGGSAAQQRDDLFKVLQKRLFYLAFFCYPLATPVIVSVFDCRTVAGTPYLTADFKLACKGGTYALAATWSALWTFGFVLGFPAAVALALRRRLEVVDFLAKDYKGGDVQRMWEVVDLGRKLLLSSAVLFVPEGSVERISIALLISVTFQVQQAYHQPYNSMYKNRMADAAGAALSLTYYLTLLVEASPLAKDQEALGVLMILVLCFVLLAGIFALVAMKGQVVLLSGRKARQSSVSVDIEMRAMPPSVTNPAYEVEEDESKANSVAELKANSVAELKAELATAKCEHAKYTSARIAAELEKVQAVHDAELEKAVAAGRDEAAQLKAELAQLKKRLRLESSVSKS
jgi:hypothetical protein